MFGLINTLITFDLSQITLSVYRSQIVLPGQNDIQKT